VPVCRGYITLEELVIMVRGIFGKIGTVMVDDVWDAKRFDEALA
jgi:hypothetical protein